MTSYQHSLNYLYRLLLKTNPNANKIFYIIKSRVKNSENFNDRQREVKFQNLLSLKKNDLQSPTVIIHNLTDKALPENI